MVFSSKFFLFAFLPVTLLLYFITPRKLKNYLLLAVSLFFYGFGEPKFVLVMVASILVNYSLALLIHHAQTRGGRKAAAARITMAAAVVMNIGMLFIFKYLDFFIVSVNQVLGASIALRKIALPIGISFFTFQVLSYVIDVYRGVAAVQRNPFKLGMYVAFFPQLIAGPIVRYIDIAHEIDERKVDAEGFSSGVTRFVAGLAKKVLIADILAVNADSIFSLAPGELTAPIAWIGIISYSFQIYFDFSGYSDMAIGLGRMFGFHFLENFNYPYVSKSITEFWRRWHISLSTWFRDYLYIPMGGNRRGNVYVNLFVVFLATGMWHGAAVTFLVWGLWHGAFLIIERMLKKSRFSLDKVPAVFQRAITLLVVVVGWVVFRAESMPYAFQYLGAMFGQTANGFKPYSPSHYLDGRVIFIACAALVASTGILPRLFKKAESLTAVNKAGIVLKYVLSIVLLAVSILFVMNQGYSPFIYFRF